MRGPVTLHPSSMRDASFDHAKVSWRLIELAGTLRHSQAPGQHSGLSRVRAERMLTTTSSWVWPSNMYCEYPPNIEINCKRTTNHAPFIVVVFLGKHELDLRINRSVSSANMIDL